MISSSRRSESHIAIADLPDAVGPQMTGMVVSALVDVEPASPPSKATLELIPGEMDDGRPTVHVVRSQLALAQRDEQRAHFLRGKRVTGFDGRLAGDGGRKMLMTRRGRGRTVAGERRQRIAETALRVESRMRRRHRMHDDGL